MTVPAPAMDLHWIGYLPEDDDLHAVEVAGLHGTLVEGGAVDVPARCGLRVHTATPGTRHFGRGFTRRDDGYPRPWRTCPTCRWHVAVDADTWHEEIAALTPQDGAAAALVVAGWDVGTVPRLLGAAINRAVGDADGGGLAWREVDWLVPVLARITAHAPVLTDDTGDPARPVCPACSLLTENGNGGDGWYEIATPAPCEVLRGVAEFLGEEIDHG